MSSMADKIMKRVAAHHRGQWVYSPKALLNLGSRETVDQALLRLVKAERLRRVGRGLYDMPKFSKVLKRTVLVDLEAAIAALARRDGIRIMPDGLVAANQLDLTKRGTRQGQLCDRRPFQDAQDRRPHGPVPTCRAKRHAMGGEAGGSGGSGAEVAWPRCRVDSRVLSTLSRQLPEHVKRDLMQNEHNLPGWALPLARSITNGQRLSYEWRFRVEA